MGFFDDYDAFMETSKTGANANRLNKRHQAIFQTNPGIFEGARVLDIASHDGRWSFAALKSGAKHVTGVEPRQHLVQNASSTFKEYGIPDSSYTFERSDIFDYLRRSESPFDIVLCLGFLYHTYRHPELFSLIKRAAPMHLIIDSAVAKANSLVCVVRKDMADKEFEAAENETTFRGATYVATPSLTLVRDMLAHYEFEIQEVDWTSLVGSDVFGIRDYAEGRRATLICRSV